MLSDPGCQFVSEWTQDRHFLARADVLLHDPVQLCQIQCVFPWFLPVYLSQVLRFFWHASYFFLEKGLYFTTSAMQRHDIISLEAMRRAGVDLEENKYCHQTCPLHLKPLQHFQSGAC